MQFVGVRKLGPSAWAVYGAVVGGAMRDSITTAP